ncbi:MAG: two component system sensor histidine kinase, hybrid [Candidatus Brocadiaceae bacterium]|nr:two component system sensor histidine kinase, hybrid [Candidatus Brocadiaceae bacterium]
MTSIRTKLILYVNITIAIMDLISIFLFFVYLKKNEQKSLEKLGISLVSLISQDNEVKQALSYVQPALLSIPIQRMLSLDRSGEVAYWRMLNADGGLVEENVQGVHPDANEIPIEMEGRQNSPFFPPRIITGSRGKFYHFTAAIFESTPFSEEVFAAQMLDGEDVTRQKEGRILGYAQVGLSTRKMNSKILKIIFYSVIPAGLGIFLGGLCITLLLTKHIISPIRRLTGVTQGIARGDLTRKVEVQSEDEIGQLSIHFNQMTESLQKSYNALNLEINEHKQTEALLRHRVKSEEVIASISANFINLTPTEVDSGINRSLAMLGEFVDIDRCYVCLYSNDENTSMDNTHEWCAKGIEPQIEMLKDVPVEQFPWGMEKLKQLETIHIPRVADLPAYAEAEKELLQLQSVQSFVIVPMAYGGTLIGFLGCDSVLSEKQWPEQDVALLKIVGEIFVNALEHKRQQDMLQKAHNQLEIRVRERTAELLKTNTLLEQAKEYAENLIETANVMVIGLDLQGTVQVFNKAAEIVTGYKKDDVLGKNCFKILMPNDVWFDSKQSFSRWRANRRMQDTYESPILTKFGKKRYLSWQSSEIIDQGDVIGIISFGNDITDHKQKELLIEQLRIMAFVKDVGIAINQGETLSEILQQCAEAIVSNLDAAFARIWTLNEKEDMLELQAGAGVYTSKNGVHSRIPVGVMKVGLIARNRIPMVTNDLSKYPYVSDPDWVRREGLVAFAGYPLIAKDRIVGVMGIFARKPIIESMLNALAAAADIIAMGIDRKRAAEALSISENKYRVLLENLPQRIFYKDINFVYVSCSENYAKDLNVRPEEIVGKTDYDFYPKELAEKYRTDDKKVVESGQTIDVEEKYVKDEKEFFAHTIKTPLRDEHGAIIGILGVFLDVSEKVALQMEAEHVRHLVSLGELAAGVAHEINNPIMGVINCAQILFDKGSDGSREKDVANRIIKEGKRIANIVSRLLSYARRGEAKESAEIHTLVSEALALSDAQLHKEGILINVNIPQQLPALFVQPQQIQQVFLNLISNARYSLNQKYPGEHAGKTLDISARQISINNSPYIRIEFYDRGMGIPAGILGKIMEPFFTSKPKGKGTGLGLSISHGIISGHGGKLSVESNEGEFTRIIITLPVAQEA